MSLFKESFFYIFQTLSWTIIMSVFEEFIGFSFNRTHSSNLTKLLELIADSLEII